MHDWIEVASDGYAVNFRIAEQDGQAGCRSGGSPTMQRELKVDGSKDCQMKPGRIRHGEDTSNRAGIPGFP
jgi:hypothetical protein